MTQVQTRQQVFARIGGRAADIRRLGVHRLGLFGSFGRDEATAGSDVDVLVHFHRGEKTYANLFALSELLKEILDREVEVVTPESLPEAIRERILQDVEYVEEAGRISR